MKTNVAISYPPCVYTNLLGFIIPSMMLETSRQNAPAYSPLTLLLQTRKQSQEIREAERILASLFTMENVPTDTSI